MHNLRINNGLFRRINMHNLQTLKILNLFSYLVVEKQVLQYNIDRFSSTSLTQCIVYEHKDILRILLLFLLVHTFLFYIIAGNTYAIVLVIISWKRAKKFYICSNALVRTHIGSNIGICIPFAVYTLQSEAILPDWN